MEIARSAKMLDWEIFGCSDARDREFHFLSAKIGCTDSPRRRHQGIAFPPTICALNSFHDRVMRNWPKNVRSALVGF
jgi:hypothetical protein